MTSPSPLRFATYYHIYNRGVNRENLFRETRNYAYFLRLYTRYIEPVAETFAYCLLKNHFHLLVRIKSKAEIMQTPKEVTEGTPSKHFSDCFNAYAKAINKAYGRVGSLFQHPFGRVVVAYIHQNPQKHGFVGDFREWPYSSYGALLSDQPTQLQRASVLARFGGPHQFAATHLAWVSEAQGEGFVDDID